MDKNIRILHLEDKRSDADIVKRELKKSHLQFDLLWVTNEKDFQKALEEFVPNIILSDHSLPSFGSLEALKILRQTGMDIPFILVTGTLSDQSAVDLLRISISDYILKDHLQRLNNAIVNCLKRYNSEKEKQKYYEEVCRNEKLFRAMIEKNADMMTLALPDGRFLYASPSLSAILGFTNKEYCNRLAFEFIHPDDLSGLVRKLKEIINSPGQSFYFQKRILRKDGPYVWCEGTITNMLHDPDIGALVSNFREITKRKCAEDEVIQAKIKLEQNEKRLKEAQSIANVGNWELNFATGKFIWSDEACRIYGIPIEENTRQTFDTWIDFIHPEDLYSVKKDVERIHATFNDSSFEHRIVRKDGTIRYIHSVGKFEFDMQGKPIGLFGICHDITKRKKSEIKIAQSEIQIRNFAKHLNKIQEEERAHLAREMHDELGQQLAGIKMGLSLITMLGDKDKMIERARNTIKDVDVAIQSMRKIATELRPGILDSLGLIPSLEWLAGEFERRKEIKCIIKMNVKELRFEKNISTCFFRVCQESLTNIFKHAGASEVNIQVDQNERELILKITDNGKGIANDKLDNPFSMGLLGMRERASAINADLVVSSKVDFGTAILLKASIN